MQTLSRPKPTVGPGSLTAPRRRRRFSPLMFIGVGITLLAIIGAGVFFVAQKLVGSHAAAANVNLNCTLIVPAHPLSAQGLATPWQLTATDPNAGPCTMANPMQATFVQGAVIDPATGKVSIYNPLVVDKGTQPAIAPTVPTLPKNAIVALWGGSNANAITLQGKTGNALQQGNCINGNNGSVFGQFWYCNAPAFFAAANQAIQQGQLTLPQLGMGKDGKPCMTTRDFGLVDMDQSDNVTTTYLVTANGQTAQMTAANMAALQNVQTLTNGSDERLLAVAVDGALGCAAFTAPDLADNGNMVPALPLNELMAAARQGAPMALVPNGDPMVLNNAKRDMNKLNLYRAGVDQPAVQTFGQASTRAYCKNLMNVGPARIMLDAQFTLVRPSPDAAAANSLATFLAQRFATTFGANGLNCTTLLNVPNPVAVQVDNNGVAISATINNVALGGGNNGGGNGGANGAPNCTINGTTVNGCTGTTTVNGQSCTISFANNTVNMQCQPQVQGVPQQNGNGNGLQQQQQNGQPAVVGGMDGGKGKRNVQGNPQAQD